MVIANIYAMVGTMNENEKARLTIDIQISDVKYFGDVQVQLVGPRHFTANCNFSNGMQSAYLDGTINDYNMVEWTIENDHPFKHNAPYVGSEIEKELVRLGLIPVYDYTLRLDWLDNRSGNFVRENVGVYSQAAPIGFIGLCNVERNDFNQCIGHFKLRFQLSDRHTFAYHYDGTIDRTIIHGFIISETLFPNNQGKSIREMILN
jgi:hypothetical protein